MRGVRALTGGYRQLCYQEASTPLSTSHYCPLASPQPSTEEERWASTSPSPHFFSPWITQELEFVLEPPPACVPHHLVLEAAQELSEVVRRQLVQTLVQKDNLRTIPMASPAMEQGKRIPRPTATATQSEQGFFHKTLKEGLQLTLQV